MQVVDIFTKPLQQTKFVELRALLGVKEIVLKGGSLNTPPFFPIYVLIILYMGTLAGLVARTHFCLFLCIPPLA